MPKKNDPITPGDLVTAIFGGDKEAVLRSIGNKSPEKKYKKRTIKRNTKGDPVVGKTEFTAEYLKKEKAKKAKKEKKV